MYRSLSTNIPEFSKFRLFPLSRLAWDTSEVILASHESKSFESPLDCRSIDLYQSLDDNKAWEPFLKTARAKLVKILDQNFGILEADGCWVILKNWKIVIPGSPFKLLSPFKQPYVENDRRRVNSTKLVSWWLCQLTYFVTILISEH